jgi:Uma2 family endonuclease
MPTPTIALPVLESGDHLSRTEFHHRYCAREDLKKAELVEGVVYVASPVSPFHSEPHGDVVGWLFTYRVQHPDVQLNVDSTVLLDADNEVQPDACLWRSEPGGPHLTADGRFIDGAPQLVVEVAASSASYELHQKFEAYRRNGVLEYLVWQVLDEQFNWFRLENGAYMRVEPDTRGVIESSVFPGLRLNVAKLLAGDRAGMLAELG